MLPKNYTVTRANKLARFKFSPITEPININIMWLQSVSYENGKRLISKKTHRHSFYEAHFIMRGSMIYTKEDGKEYHVGEGCHILFAPDVRHTATFFSDDLVRMSMAFLPREGATDGMLISGGTVCGAMPEYFDKCFDDIFSEADAKSIFSATVIKNRLLDIIRIYVNEKSFVAPTAYGDGSDLRIDMVKRYISDNKNVLLTCRDVAEQCHFNTKYLNRIFKEHTGMTLLEYIHTEKMRDAERLLTSSTMSLSEISRYLGFGNEYYFNSFFKRCSGLTPGLYRKLSQK